MNGAKRPGARARETNLDHLPLRLAIAGVGVNTNHLAAAVPEPFHEHSFGDSLVRTAQAKSVPKRLAHPGTAGSIFAPVGAEADSPRRQPWDSWPAQVRQPRKQCAAKVWHCRPRLCFRGVRDESPHPSCFRGGVFGTKEVSGETSPDRLFRPAEAARNARPRYTTARAVGYALSPLRGWFARFPRVPR